MRNIKHAIRGAFSARQNRYRQVLPNPLNQASPWYFTAGPIFNPGADGAILNSKLSKPWQTLFGYAYRVANPRAFDVTQPNQLYAPKGVPLVGINIQTGWIPVTSPAVNDDGTYVTEPGVYAANGTLTNEEGAAQSSYI